MRIIGSGTQTTDGLEDVLIDDTTGSVYVGMFDVSVMLGGDSITIRIYTRPLTSPLQIVRSYVLTGPQSNGIFLTDVIPADLECKFTIQRTAGVDHPYQWKVLGLQ